MRVRLRQIILTRILWIERTEVVFMEKPLVSVVMPVYNGERYIGKAIESALGQEVPVEVLVIDDCSADGTELAVMKYMDSGKIRYIRNEQNMGAARSKLKAQTEVMEQTGCAICSTGRELMTPDGRTTGKYIPVKERITYRELLKHNSINCSSVLLRREDALAFPMEHDDSDEDYITWLRILRKGGFAIGINRPYLKYRLSEGGKSRNKLKSAAMTYQVYRYVGYGPLKSLFFFVSYALHGIWKYR